MSTATWDGRTLSLYDSEEPNTRSWICHASARHLSYEFGAMGNYRIEALTIISQPKYVETVLQVLEAMEGDQFKEFYQIAYQTGVITPDFWFHLMVVTKNAVHRVHLNVAKKFCVFQVSDVDEPTAIGNSAMLASILMRQGVPGDLAAVASVLDDTHSRVAQRVKTLDLSKEDDPWGDSEFHGEYSVACQILEHTKAAKGWFRPTPHRS